MSRPAFPLGFALLAVTLAGAGVAAPDGTFDGLEPFASAVGLKKGGWKTSVKVTSAQIGPSPDADPDRIAEVRERIGMLLGEVDERDECSGLSPEGRPLLPGILLDPGCSVSGLRAAGGRWSLICAASEDGETANLKSEGTYSRRHVTGRHQGVINFRGVAIHLTAQTESRWAGKKCRSPKPNLVTATSASAEPR